MDIADFDEHAVSPGDTASLAGASADSNGKYCLNVDDYLQELRQKFPWRDYLSCRLSS